MTVYRVGWLTFCGVVGVAGVLSALSWDLPTLILLSALAALIGAAAAMVALTPADPDKQQPRPDRWSVVIRGTVLAGIGTTAFVGLGTLLGAPMAVLALLLAVGGSPYVSRCWLGWLRAHQQHAAEPIEVVEYAAPPAPERSEMAVVEAAEMSDDALCLAWRASFAALEKASTPAVRLHIVEMRRTLLDELHRRNPPGVAAWLASGARAAGNPARFVLGDAAHGRAPIDWDRLTQGTDT